MSKIKEKFLFRSTWCRRLSASQWWIGLFTCEERPGHPPLPTLFSRVSCFDSLLWHRHLLLQGPLDLRTPKSKPGNPADSQAARLKGIDTRLVLLREAPEPRQGRSLFVSHDVVCGFSYHVSVGRETPSHTHALPLLPHSQDGPARDYSGEYESFGEEDGVRGERPFGHPRDGHREGAAGG